MTKVMIEAADAASATPIVIFQSCNTEVLSSFFVFTVVMSMGGECFCLIPPFELSGRIVDASSHTRGDSSYFGQAASMERYSGKPSFS